VKNLFPSFLVIACGFCLLCLLEAGGLLLGGAELMGEDLGKAVAGALIAAIVLALPVSAWGAFKNRTGANEIPALSAIASGLAMAFLLVVLLLRPFIFSDTGVMAWAGLLALAVLLYVLGRLFWRVSTKEGVPLYLVAIAPMAALFASIVSVSSEVMSDPNRISLSAVIAGFIFVLLYYSARWAVHRGGSAAVAMGPLARAAVIVITLVIGAGSWFFAKRAQPPATAESNSPPIVLITVDTLRQDSAMEVTSGGPGGLPPNMGALSEGAYRSLAKDGITFDNAVAPSTWTPTSVASIITGLYPTACGAGTLIPGDPYDYTGPLFSATTLAEVMSDNGYMTAGFVDSAWCYPSRGYAQGFSEYRLLQDFRLEPRFLFSRAWQLVAAMVRPENRLPAERVSELAINWLRDRPEGPFFLWVHFYDPHLPYYPQPRYPATVEPGPMTWKLALQASPTDIRSGFFGIDEKDRRFLRQRYEGEVRYTEDQVGRLIEELKDLGIYNRAVIAFASDHGEEFWEHGGFEHGHSFHSEILHVPMIVKLPANQASSARVESWVSVKDLGATILNAAGISSDFPGRSLLQCLSGPACGASSIEDLFWMSEKTLYGTEIGAVGDMGGHKAILHGDGTISCYDLATDPDESGPLPEESCPWAEGAPGPREMFSMLMDDAHGSFIAMGGNEESREKASRAEIKHLRALGYVR